MTEDEQAAIIIAALDDALAPAKAYEYGDVPGSNGNAGVTPERYVLVDLSRRFVAGRLLSGEARTKGWRLGTRYVAKLTADARTLRQRVTNTLENRIIRTPAGDEVGPFVFESAEAIRPDDGYQSGSDVWTF